MEPARNLTGGMDLTGSSPQTFALPLTGLSLEWHPASDEYLVLTHDDQRRLPVSETASRRTPWSGQTDVVTRAEPVNNRLPSTSAWALWGETAEVSPEGAPVVVLDDGEALTVHVLGGVWAAETSHPIQAAEIRWPDHTVRFRVAAPGRRR